MTSKEKNMNDDEKISAKEALRMKKVKEDEAKALARDQARAKAYLAREQEIEKGQKIKETQRVKERADEELQDVAKEKARKEAYQAREKAISEDQEARKLKNG
jgi:predicted DNA-binding protein